MQLEVLGLTAPPVLVEDVVDGFKRVYSHGEVVSPQHNYIPPANFLTPSTFWLLFAIPIQLGTDGSR